MTPEYRIETEKSIKEYLSTQGDVDEVISIKCEETFNDLGFIVNVWNVKTKSKGYWVVEGQTVPMNLYPHEAYYFSADEAYSFHLGLTQRLAKREEIEFKHIINEIPLDIEHLKSIKRKLNLASEKLQIQLEPEEFQSIGLVCRESLVELSKDLYTRNPELIKAKGLKRSDFKGIANAFIDLYIPGKQNADLRNYSRRLIENAWNYNSAVVHSQNKKFPDVKIALLFTSCAISLMENLFLKHFGFDQDLYCSECGSLQVKFIDNDDGTMTSVCQVCENEDLITFVED